jgi:hypothetical protein
MGTKFKFDIDEVMRLYVAKLPLAQIAKLLGGSVRGVKNAIHRLRQVRPATAPARRRRAFSKLDNRLVFKLHQQGMRPKEIAQIMGRPVGTIRQKLYVSRLVHTPTVIPCQSQTLNEWFETQWVSDHELSNELCYEICQ